jgi:hypothetical protein
MKNVEQNPLGFFSAARNRIPIKIIFKIVISFCDKNSTIFTKSKEIFLI